MKTSQASEVFLSRVLDKPSYGFEKAGALYVPTRSEILKEFFSRLNIFKSRKNWLPLFGWATSLSFAIPLALFLTFYFNWLYLAIGFVYSMVFLGTHGTIWLHRYSTHRAYRFRNPFFRTIVRNLVIKIIPEEIYVISHHVHHFCSEKPGDPYNPGAGWLYCFLADVNHQTLNKNLSPQDYKKVCSMMNQTGVKLNSYEQYRYWGSLCHPFYTVMHYALNWTFWYGAFYLIGGHSLALALFGMSGVWAIGVRTFNYDGHGGGVDKRQDGIDFYREDLSINRMWPGYVAGEWHNNHHLYPNSARCGFLPYQVDMAWAFIKFSSLIGAVTAYKDNKPDFLRDYHRPYLEKKRKKAAVPVVEPTASPTS